MSAYIKNPVIDADDNKQHHHAFKVMQSYVEHLQNTPQLQLLMLLGLFDHPIENEVIALLWQTPLSGFNTFNNDWKKAIAALHYDYHLLFTHETNSNLLDCHPLIREFFGQRLQTNHPAWQTAHERLYHYYKELAKPLPDTVAEMQPLFHAVSHGCSAGLYQQAYDDVYWKRIQRGNENYLIDKLGAFSDDLAVLAHFFMKTWQTPAPALAEADQAVALSNAGFRLRALGRLREAVQPMQAGMLMSDKQQDWKGAGKDANNLSELLLSLGEITQAISYAQTSVDYADRSKDLFLRMGFRTTLADALARSGDSEQALVLFEQAEQMQQQHEPNYPLLYSVQGFRYCDVLLNRGRVAEVLQRAEQTLVWVTQAEWLLDIALDQLNIAHAQQQLAQHQKAREFFDFAVTGLHQAERQDYLPRGLLARAGFYRQQGEFAPAEKDLAEVFDIASYSAMRLFLCDYHLEMARLALALKQSAQTHIQQAEQLINQTGYHRRDKELAALKQA